MFTLPGRLYRAVIPSDIWPTAPIPPAPDEIEPPPLPPPAIPDDWQPPHPWDGRWTRRAPSRLVDEIAAAHTAHLRHVAALPDGGAVLGPTATSWHETKPAPYYVPQKASR